MECPTWQPLNVQKHPLLMLVFAVLLFSQFEKEEQVHSIDIGNEGSAFIEVLVGNSSAVRDQDYEVKPKVHPLRLVSMLLVAPRFPLIFFMSFSLF